MFLDPGTKFMEVCNDHLLSFVSCVWWWCKRVYQTTFYLYLIQFRSFRARWGQVYIYIFVRVCVFICLVLGFSFFMLCFCLLFAARVITRPRHAISSFFFCFMIALSLCLFLQLWHLRAPLRKRWQKDEWPRYFRTQLLFLPQLASIPSCIRTEESYGDRREGTSSTISSVTNAVFTPGEEGKVIQQPPPHTHTHHLLTITHIKYLPPRHANTDAHNSCEKVFFFPLGTMQSVYGCVWKTAHFNDLPDMLSFGSAFFFWPKRLNWLCVL